MESLNAKLRNKLLNDHGFTVILLMVAPVPAALARELVGAERREELGWACRKIRDKSTGYMDLSIGST